MKIPSKIRILVLLFFYDLTYFFTGFLVGTDLEICTCNLILTTILIMLILVLAEIFPRAIYAKRVIKEKEENISKRFIEEYRKAHKLNKTKEVMRKVGCENIFGSKVLCGDSNIDLSFPSNNFRLVNFYYCDKHK